jgi:hypothetical protein
LCYQQGELRYFPEVSACRQGEWQYFPAERPYRLLE